MKKFLFVMLFALASTLGTSAQSYDNAIGLRIGYPTSVTYKHFFNDTWAFEVMAGTFFSNGFDLTAVVANHHEIFVSDFNLYYGFGGHIGTYRNVEKKTKLNLGADGIFGFEYTFSAPVCFGFDFKPSIGFVGGKLRWIPGGGLNFRYILN